MKWMSLILSIGFFLCGSLYAKETHQGVCGPPGTVAASAASTDSAFGVYTSHRLDQRFMGAVGLDDEGMFQWCDRHMAALGAKWTRFSLLAVWQLIEPTLGGGYNWSAQGPNGAPDAILAAVYAPGNDIHAVINIQALSIEAGPPARSPFTNPTEYAAFVTALAERYDGDGVDDAPGSIKVDYFQLANEVQDWFDRGLTPDQYVQAAKITLGALRSANPNAQLVTMGAFTFNSGGTLEDRYKALLKGLSTEGVRPAAMDIHWWFWDEGASPWQAPVIVDARRYLDSIGFNDVQIWSMENGVWVGCPTNLPVLSEEDQARVLVKRYAWGRANGIDKLFWQELLDMYNFGGKPDSPFNSAGLVDDGEQNCSDIARRNTERVAYWSYMKLAQLTDNLVATPSGTVSGTHDGSSVFAYDYTRREDGTHAYVVWREGGAGPVTLAVTGSAWRATNLVPDRFGTFQESAVTALGGSLTLQADSDPLLVTPSLQAGFAISAETPAPIQAGGTGSVVVTATRTSGHSAAISLSLDANTQGISGSGSIAQGATTGTLTIGVPSTVVAGTYALTVSGSDGSLPAQTTHVNMTVTEAAGPVPASLKKQASPFAIVVTGSNFQNGVKVLINGIQWSSVAWKSESKIKLTGGASLKAAAPKGVPAQFEFVNPDGGVASVTWQW